MEEYFFHQKQILKKGSPDQKSRRRAQKRVTVPLLARSSGQTVLGGTSYIITSS